MVVANKLPPVILAADVMLPVELIIPPVNTLPPVILALTDTVEPTWLAADTVVVARILPPSTLPVAETFPVAEYVPANKVS